MNIQTPIRSLLLIGMAAGLAQPSAYADDAASLLGFGALRGVTLDASGKPVSRVNVAIGSADGGPVRNVVSDVDGVFDVERMMPGAYRITAAKAGLAGTATTTVLIAKDHITRASLVMAAADSIPAATPSPTATAMTPATMEQELDALKERIALLEAALKARPVENAPAGKESRSASTATAEPPPERMPADAPRPQAGGKAPAVATPPPPVPVPQLPDALNARPQAQR